MISIKKIKLWLVQMRANFLILSIFLIAIGFAFSLKFPGEKTFDIEIGIIILIGLLMAHISVNLFNEYFDFKTRIDFHTSKTPFSGGTGLLVKGITKPNHVFIVAFISLVIAIIAGIYIAFRTHWILFIYLAIGAFTILFYTKLLSRLMIGEFFAGMTLGFMVVSGTYIGMTASYDTPIVDLAPAEVWYISIIPALLTWILLLLNEFPDLEADKTGGRNHLVIALGKEKATYLYVFVLTIVYLIIFLLPIFGLAPYYLHISLVTIPIAVRIITIILKDNEKIVKFLPAMGINMVLVLLINALIAVSISISI